MQNTREGYISHSRVLARFGGGNMGSHARARGETRLALYHAFERVEHGVNRRNNRVRVGYETGIGGDTDYHLTRIAENAHTQTEVRRMRHPEHAAADGLTREKEGLTRSRHVGHHCRPFHAKD